jgi:hypothetical protein
MAWYDELMKEVEEKIPLTKKVVSAVTPSNVKKAGETLAKKVYSWVEEDAAKKKKMSFGEAAKETLVKEPLSLIGSLTKPLVQAPLKASTELFLPASQYAVNKGDLSKVGEEVKLGKIGKEIFGTDTLTPFSTKIQKTKEATKEFGGSKLEQSIYGYSLPAIGGFMDLYPGGSEAKGLKNQMLKNSAIRDTIENIAKSNIDTDIESSLRRLAPELKEETKKTLIKQFKDETDPSKIAKALDESVFLETKPEPGSFFHGAPKEQSDAIVTQGIKAGAKSDGYGVGLSLTDDTKTALSFAKKTVDEGNVFEIKLKPGAVGVDGDVFLSRLSTLQDELRATTKSFEEAKRKAEEAVTKQLRDEGVDYIDYRNTRKAFDQSSEREIRLINPEAITKQSIALENRLSTPGIKGTFDPDNYAAEMIKKQKDASKGEAKNIFSAFKSQAKNKLIDFTAPIEDAVRVALKKSKVSQLPQYDISNQIDRVLRNKNIASQFIRDGGLEEVIMKVGKDIDKLNQYLIARHSIDVDTRGINTGRELLKDQALVRAWAPRFEGYAKQVTGYSQKLLQESVKAGIISPEMAMKLNEMYPNYVPMNRIFNELEMPNSIFGKKGIANLSKQKIVQALEGSDREVANPIESLFARTYSAIEQVEKNKTAQILTSMEKLPGNPLGIRRVENASDVARDMDVVSVYRNGVKELYEVPKEIADAAKALNVQQFGILAQVFAIPARIARVGITGLNPAFLLANLSKDQLTAAINSNTGLRNSVLNPFNFIRALTSAVKHDELYDQWIRSGAGGTAFDISREQLPKTIKSIQSKASVPKYISHTVTHPSQLVRLIEDVLARGEETTRLQVFSAEKQKLLKMGYSEADALAGAAKESRTSTVNFARRGEWGQQLNAAFLYLNANIQGVRTLTRNLKEKPVRTTARLVAYAAMPVALATAWNLSDPKRKAIYEDIPDYEKENNLIFITDETTKNENGKWNVIKIPLAPGISSFASIPRLAIEQMQKVDEYGFMDFASKLVGTVSPFDFKERAFVSQFVPQAIKPSVELMTNQNLFTGFPIASEEELKRSPELQYRDNTSGTAKIVGEKTGISPLKFESFIKSTFGGLGSNALNTLDQALAKAGVISEEEIGGKSFWQSIVGRFNEASGGRLNQKEIDSIGSYIKDQADDRFLNKQEAEKIRETLKDQEKTAQNKYLSQLRKENKPVYEAYKTIIEQEKKGLDYSDRVISDLGVTNGVRAKYLYSLMKDMGTEEKNAFVKDMKKKKLISPTVASQIKRLQRNTGEKQKTIAEILAE